MRYKVFLGSILFLGIVVIILAQFSIPTIFGADGYLHIRMANFLRQYGPHYNFHWARYSVFAQHFADKDFLYHVLLVPFTFLSDIFWGAKLSACLFTAMFYLGFWLVLRRYCSQKKLIPFFLLAFFCSAPFLVAITQARNMVIVLALTLFYIDALVRKKPRVLFALAAVYALTHVSSPYLLLYALLAEGVRFLNEREFNWKSIWATALGLLAGFLLHPNFPNNFLIFYLNGVLVPIFALKWGLELGAEFFPTDTRQFVLGYPLILIGLLALIILSLNQAKKPKTQTQIWLSLSGLFFVFSFFSQRYLVHAYPLILVALASYFSDCQAHKGLTKQAKPWPAVRMAGIILVFVLLGYNAYKDFRQRAASERIYNQHYEAVGKLMAAHLPAGEVVFHANWSDAQFFIGLNPQDDYFVTLDPIYMYWWDPRLYNLYRDIAFGRTGDPYAALKEVFSVRYGYASKNYFSRLISQIRQDARFEVMAEDGFGLIFRLN